jgi:hypothetical protein
MKIHVYIKTKYVRPCLNATSLIQYVWVQYVRPVMCLYNGLYAVGNLLLSDIKKGSNRMYRFPT